MARNVGADEQLINFISQQKLNDNLELK